MPYLNCFQVISIKNLYNSFELENVGQGQIQGHQNEAIYDFLSMINSDYIPTCILLCFQVISLKRYK